MLQVLKAKFSPRILQAAITKIPGQYAAHLAIMYNMDVQFSGMAPKTLSKVDVVLVLIFAYLSLRLLRNIITSIRTGTSPPGPPGIPLLGNAYQIPSDRQWLKFDEWTRKYGRHTRSAPHSDAKCVAGRRRRANNRHRSTNYNPRICPGCQ